MTFLTSKLASARQAVRGGRGYVYDRAKRPCPTSPDQVPPAPERLTTQWLTKALCNGLNAVVTSFDVEPISTGSTCRSRLSLRYDGDADAVATLPATAFVKSTATFLTRLQVGATGGMSGEVRFYKRIAPTTPIVAPIGYYGICDRRSGRSILLLEDLARTRDVTFGDVRATLDRAHAEALVDSLACVHGCLLESPRFAGDLKWVISSQTLQDVLNTYVDSRGRSVAGMDLAGDVLPPGLRARRDDLHDYRMRALRLDDENPLGLVHHDVHSGNWFATANGMMGLFDWSAYARGQGARDVAYALMSSLTVADRRSWERDLVVRYADTLGRVCGRAQDPAATWLAYRRQTLHGLCFWLATLGSGFLQPKMQTDETSLENLRRMGQAVVDLDTFRALDG
jgi:hypothetical protein